MHLVRPSFAPQRALPATGAKGASRDPRRAGRAARWRLGLTVAAALLGGASIAMAQAPSPAPAPAAKPLPKPGTAPIRAAASGAEPTRVEAPWVRATVAQQRSTGAFLKLTARERVKLVGAESPVADIVEIHEMALVDNVMRMRAVEAIPLVAGQSLELRPGGYHVMLIDLRQQVKVGDQVALTLVFEDEKGQRITQAVTAPVRSLTDSGKGDGGHGAAHGAGGHGAAGHGTAGHGAAGHGSAGHGAAGHDAAGHGTMAPGGRGQGGSRP